MRHNRREFLQTSASVAATLAAGRSVGATQKFTENAAISGKRLGSIYNNDGDSILIASSGKNITPEEYQRAVYAILDLKPGVLAQEVGLPDPVTYRSSVATTLDKYYEEMCYLVWPESKATPEVATRRSAALRKLLDLGTDPLTLTIAAGRERGIPIVTSFRMNAEDFYQGTGLLSDFGRAHPEWKIPGANCLDPAVPEVYAHRMDIFREVAERYDIDGIEFDWRRWYHMVSDPLKNYPVLTRMVRDTRKMLDETARKKSRKKLLLGVRVGPSLAADPTPFVYPGCMFYLTSPVNGSCKALGLDVKTWIAEGLVDYVCPALFGPHGLPRTREFAELTRKTKGGLYPTWWAFAGWQHGIFEMDKTLPRSISLEKKDQEMLALYKDDLCANALKLYEDGADGISTFNCYAHLWNGKLPNAGPANTPGGPGDGGLAVQTQIYPLLKDPAAIRRYREEPWAVPPQA